MAEDMFGVMIQRLDGSNSYSALTLADTKIYDSIVAHLSTDEGRKMTGLEFICGVKVPGECVDVVSVYASNLAERVGNGQKIDMKKALEIYAREVCLNLTIH